MGEGGVLNEDSPPQPCLCLLYSGQMKSNRVCESPGLQTLFLEVLLKLLKQGFVPSKLGQEVTRWAQPPLPPRLNILRTDPGLVGSPLIFLPPRECPEFWIHFLGPRSSLAKDKYLPVLLAFSTCKMEEIEKWCLSPLSHFSPPSYYLKKQRALRLSTCSKSRARSQGRPARAHTGLTFFCQAERLSGLSSTQLARSLHTLYRAGAPQAGRGRGDGGARNRGGTPREVEMMLQVIRI